MIADAAERLIALDPDPVPAYLLDQLTGNIRRSVRRAYLAAPETTVLDGSFETIHGSSGTCAEQVVARMVHIGLPSRHPAVEEIAGALAAVLAGGPYRDQPEPNDRWATGIRLFAACSLAWLRPGHRYVKREQRLWSRVARTAFASGRFNANDEIEAHRRITGASVENQYLRLHNKYSAFLLSNARHLEPAVRRRYFEWLWGQPHLLYLFTSPSSTITRAGRHAGAWFSTQEWLSRFPEWPRAFRPHARMLARLQRKDGTWDFGARPSGNAFPLSSSWRRRRSRSIDWSIRTLRLLRQAER